MKLPKKVKAYMENNFTGVIHTTLNPMGPGAVRIHLIPPKIVDERPMPSVAIINGQDIIPVNFSWSILLAEFIKNVNEYDGRELSDKDINEIIKRTVKGVREVFYLLPASAVKRDIDIIMNTFKQVAFGETVMEPIGYMTMGEYAPYMKAPHRMDLCVSAMVKEGNWNCNLKCIHCYAAGQPLSEEEELSTGEWKEIIDKLREASIPQITFTGGEPTKRKDLLELIEYSKWFVTRLNTNGILLTKEFCESLYKASLDSIQITFYSENPEIHNKLVGANQYENTLKGIKNALAAGLSVSINTPLCTLNKDYIKTLEFLKKQGVRYVTCSGLITTGKGRTEESERLWLKEKELARILKEAAEFSFSNDMEISFTSPGWLEDDFFMENNLNTPYCGACLSNMAVTPGGNVVPCQSFLSSKPLGNMLRDDWESIWNSEECVKRRDYSSLMTGECPLRRKKDEK